MEESKLNYERLLTRENVKVRVPKDGPYMNLKDAHEFDLNGTTVSVSAHWHNGLALKNGHRNVIVNRLFYGINKADLGKNINADVIVVEKTTENGDKYIMLDIVKTSGVSVSALKFTEGGEGIPISPTKYRVNFQPL